MKKNVGISISKCLKSAEKNRRANQTARAILTAPTVGNENFLFQLFGNMLLMFLISISILPPCITYFRNKIFCNDMECECETGIIYTYFVLSWQVWSKTATM